MKPKDFDRWAQVYDQQMPVATDQFPFIGYYDVLSTLFEATQVQPGDKFLDIGIGTGTLSHRLSLEGARIFGVDFSPKMIEIANKKISNGEFEIADITCDHLGQFSDQKFDCIISSYAIHHLDDEQKIRFIQKLISENLNENGKVIIADVGFETTLEYDKAHRDYCDHWDEDEYYLCGEKLISELSRLNLALSYRQISACAGILKYPF